MEESALRLGKFFFIRHKPVPSLLLEVENGEGKFVTVSEQDLLTSHESVDHQLWYYDRVSHTVCSKLTDFCLQVNGNIYQCYYNVFRPYISVIILSCRHILSLNDLCHCSHVVCFCAHIL